MTMRMVALGDSTSCGEGVGLRLPFEQTWPARLSAAAHADLLPLAIPGARLEDVWRDQLPVVRDTGADVVTLLVGLNDLSRSGFDRERFSTRLGELVAALRGTGALVLLGRLHDAARVLPLPPALRRTVRARTCAVNAAADACAGPRVRLLDLAALPALHHRRVWDVDRLHPNAAGHA